MKDDRTGKEQIPVSHGKVPGHRRGSSPRFQDPGEGLNEEGNILPPHLQEDQGPMTKPHVPRCARSNRIRPTDGGLEPNRPVSPLPVERITAGRCLGFAVLVACMFLVVQGAVAQDRGFGLGVIIGEPTGLSAKYWLSKVNALDFGLGWSVGGNWVGRARSHDDRGRRVHYHMDYLWHSFNAIHSNQRFPLYYGIGGRLNAGAGYDESLALRGVIGIVWLPLNTPADIFIEVVPSLELLPGTAFGLDAGIGARYYF